MIVFIKSYYVSSHSIIIYYTTHTTIYAVCLHPTPLYPHFPSPRTQRLLAQATAISLVLLLTFQVYFNSLCYAIHVRVCYWYTHVNLFLYSDVPIRQHKHHHRDSDHKTLQSAQPSSATINQPAVFGFASSGASSAKVERQSGYILLYMYVVVLNMNNAIGLFGLLTQSRSFFQKSQADAD